MRGKIIKRLMFLAACLLATAAGPVLADTTVSVTQTSYDYLNRPTCVAVRMNPLAFSSLPADTVPPVQTPPLPPISDAACKLGAASTTYGNDRITKTDYDAAGQAWKITQAYGTTDERVYQVINYGGDGEVLDVIDALGNRTHSQYDGLNRLVELDFPSPTTPGAYNTSDLAHALSTSGAYNTATCDAAHTADCEAYVYDLNNNRTSWRRRDAVYIYDCYDNLDRTVRESVGSNACTTSGSASDVFTNYDGLGRITAKRFSSTTNSQGVFYSYDGLGRVGSTTDFNGRTVSYAYNQASAKTRTVYPDGSFVDWGSGASGYNKLDALNRVTDPKHSSGSTLYALRYNSLGQRTGLSRGPSPHAVTGYTYDGIGRLATFNDDLASTPNDITWTFSYNPAGQVINWSASSAVYDYKETVNTTVIQSYDGLNRFAGIVGVPGGYDLKGNITKEGTYDTHNPTLNVFGNPARSFTYDAFNRLLSVAPVDPPATPTATLVYDPEGRLAKYSADNGSTWTSFAYDGTNLIQEYNGATSTVLETYVFGPGTDEPEVWYHGSGFVGRHFLVPNYQGSIIATTDSGSNLETTYEYGPYGEPEIAQSPSGAWAGLRFRYTGQMALFGAQLYYYKARVYEPYYGHFLQTDPIGTKDDLDLYAYTGGDPVNHSDPTGTRNTGGEQDFRQASSGFCSGDCGDVSVFSGSYPTATIIAYFVCCVEDDDAEVDPYNENALDYSTEPETYGDDDVAEPETRFRPPAPGRPALDNDPYSPSSVAARTDRPPYEPNPAHNTRSPLYNPDKDPEPYDSEQVYENSVRGNWHTWYGRNVSGQYYRYFASGLTVHYSGTVSRTMVPNDVLKLLDRAALFGR